MMMGLIIIVNLVVKDVKYVRMDKHVMYVRFQVHLEKENFQPYQINVSVRKDIILFKMKMTVNNV